MPTGGDTGNSGTPEGTVGTPIASTLVADGCMEKLEEAVV